MLQGQSESCLATPQGESQRERKMHKFCSICVAKHMRTSEVSLQVNSIFHVLPYFNNRWIALVTFAR